MFKIKLYGSPEIFVVLGADPTTSNLSTVAIKPYYCHLQKISYTMFCLGDNQVKINMVAVNKYQTQ